MTNTTPLTFLFIGDIVARPGREAVESILPDLKKEHDIDVVIANAENLSGGKGISFKTIHQMRQAGIDYFTSGNHLFFGPDWKEIVTDESLGVIRPMNYASDVPGCGVISFSKDNREIVLMNAEGTAGLEGAADNPFHAVEEALEHVHNDAIIIVDFHGDMTSEKRAMGFYLDGRVTACIGTHTHVPTADLQVLPKGTFYATDAGMTGNKDSVLGVEKEIIIDRFTYPYPRRFVWEYEGEKVFNSILFRVWPDRSVREFMRIDQVIP